MNNLMVFQKIEFGTIRTILIDNEPWFVGKDIAEILGYQNTRKAISDHVDEEDKLMGERNVTPSIIDEMGREQFPIWINESGVYSLIFNSTLPKAKEFKHIVTSEILPEIRKTGSYGVSQELIDKIAFLENQVAELMTKQNSIEERLNIPTHEISEWQTKIWEKLNLALEYYRSIPFSRAMTMEAVIEKVKYSLFISFGLSFDECKDFYLMRYPHTRPTDFEVIEDSRRYKIAFEKVVDAILLKKEAHDAFLAEMELEEDE